MLSEHTPEELELWSRIKEKLQHQINASSSMTDIEWTEVDGQLTLSKKPLLREVVLSFSSPNPYMNVHYQDEGRPSGLPLMLRFEGKRLVNNATGAIMTVDDLVTRI